MTDWEACYGRYRAIKCEWYFFETKNHCNEAVVYGKAYCEKHLEQAYKRVSKEEAEKELENDEISSFKSTANNGTIEILDNDED